MEERFFNEARAGNGLCVVFVRHDGSDILFVSVPVVGIFTKFDDLITQVFDADLEYEENRLAAERDLQVKFQKPLSGFKFPPKAYVRLEGMVTLFFGCFDSRLGLHIDDGDHQDQVNVLIQKTAGSLDNPELAMLFVSVQQNNLELRARYAVNRYWYLRLLRDRGC